MIFQLLQNAILTLPASTTNLHHVLTLFQSYRSLQLIFLLSTGVLLFNAFIQC